MIDDKLLWEEPIYEIKVDGVKDGFSYRLGQVVNLRPEGIQSNPVKRIISDIVRKVIDGEVVYMVITTNEEGEDHAVIKAFINQKIYVSFKF